MTICESHLLPAILKTARSTTSNKIVADTVVAGILMMLIVDSIEAVVDIWRNLGKFYMSNILFLTHKKKGYDFFYHTRIFFIRLLIIRILFIRIMKLKL